MNATGRASTPRLPASLPAKAVATVPSASETTGSTKRNDAAGNMVAAVPASAHHGTHAPSNALQGSIRRRTSHAPIPIAMAMAATKSSAFRTCSRVPALAIVSPAPRVTAANPQPIPAITQSSTNTARSASAAPLPGVRTRSAPRASTALHAATAATASALAITIASVHCSRHRTMNWPSTSPNTARSGGTSPAGKRSSRARTNARPVRPMWLREYGDCLSIVSSGV